MRARRLGFCWAHAVPAREVPMNAQQADAFDAVRGVLAQRQAEVAAIGETCALVEYPEETLVCEPVDPRPAGMNADDWLPLAERVRRGLGPLMPAVPIGEGAGVGLVEAEAALAAGGFQWKQNAGPVVQAEGGAGEVVAAAGGGEILEAVGDANEGQGGAVQNLPQGANEGEDDDSPPHAANGCVVPAPESPALSADSIETMNEVIDATGYGRVPNEHATQRLTPSPRPSPPAAGDGIQAAGENADDEIVAAPEAANAEDAAGVAETETAVWATPPPTPGVEQTVQWRISLPPAWNIAVHCRAEREKLVIKGADGRTRIRMANGGCATPPPKGRKRAREMAERAAEADEVAKRARGGGRETDEARRGAVGVTLGAPGTTVAMQRPVAASRQPNVAVAPGRRRGEVELASGSMYDRARVPPTIPENGQGVAPNATTAVAAATGRGMYASAPSARGNAPARPQPMEAVASNGGQGEGMHPSAPAAGGDAGGDEQAQEMGTVPANEEGAPASAPTVAVKKQKGNHAEAVVSKNASNPLATGDAAAGNKRRPNTTTLPGDGSVLYFGKLPANMATEAALLATLKATSDVVGAVIRVDLRAGRGGKNTGRSTPRAWVTYGNAKVAADALEVIEKTPALHVLRARVHNAQANMPYVNMNAPAPASAAAAAGSGSGTPVDEKRIIFFGVLPMHLLDENALLSALANASPAAGAVTHLRIVPASVVPVGARRGSAGRAWATYATPAAASAALKSILKTRSLGVLRAKVHTAPSGSLNDRFDRKATYVVGQGGLANTLIVRNAPMEAEEKEVERILGGIGVEVLRIRSAVSKGGRARHFWLTFADRVRCIVAARRIDGQSAQLRCGKTLRLTPDVHNDAADAEAVKRRQREAVLGEQESRGGAGAGAGAGAVAVVSPQEALEGLLRERTDLCLFLKGGRR